MKLAEGNRGRGPALTEDDFRQIGESKYYWEKILTQKLKYLKLFMNGNPPNRLTTPALNFRKQKHTGELGERLAEKFLISKGYKILVKNYRIRGGEIDIVAKKDGIIVFVEVKTRRGTKYGEAFEAVDYRKKSKLLRTIRQYIAENGYHSWRCDLVAINLWPRPAEIRHYKNIFLI